MSECDHRDDYGSTFVSSGPHCLLCGATPPEAESLDAAWAAAEAALPEGFSGPVLYRFEPTAELPGPYGAKALGPWASPFGDEQPDDFVYGYGPTPAAALRALAATLRDAR